MLSVVASVYNEETALPLFYEALKKELEDSVPDYEIIFVNDGSSDASLAIIKTLAAEDEKVKAISFSRNFGHESAMIAGIDYAAGDYIVCMDSDLQQPVTCIPQIMKKFEEGYDVINMVCRQNRSSGLVKRITSSLFYAFLNCVSDVKMVKNASDFFAVSGRVAEILRNNYRERVRYLRGFVQCVGFRKTTLDYTAAKRAAGQSKYSIGKLISLSADAIVCFSDVPLKLGIYAGIIAALAGIIMIVYTIIVRTGTGTLNGSTAIVVLICFMFSVLFFLLGFTGIYISALLKEIRQRPIYIVGEKINFER